MGYTIHYSPETKKRYPVNRKSKSLKHIIVAGFILLALFFAFKFRTAFVRMLLPGDPDVTAAALRGLVADVRGGNTGEAIAAFCREIIDHAAG